MRVELLEAGSHLHGHPIVVVDAYSMRADKIRPRPDLLAAIDDLARDLAVDVVVDPSPGAALADHPSATLVLAGCAYALIGSRHRDPIPAVRPHVETILVTTGGADTSGTGMRLAARLVDMISDVSIRLVLGPWSGIDVPGGVEPVLAPDGLDSELAGADLVVTAGGVTMLEAMSMGRPTVAFVTADNQRRQAEGAAALGGVLLTTPENVHLQVRRLVDDPEARRQLASKGAQLIDGCGADRIADVLITLLRRR